MKRSKARSELTALRDAALEELMATSDAQLRQEALEDGDDIDAIAKEVASSLQEGAAATLRARLAQAKKHHQPKIGERIRTSVLPTMDRIKQVVHQAFQADLALGLAYRDGKNQTDADWQTLYEDLVEIGAIVPDEDAR